VTEEKNTSAADDMTEIGAVKIVVCVNASDEVQQDGTQFYVSDAAVSNADCGSWRSAPETRRIQKAREPNGKSRNQPSAKFRGCWESQDLCLRTRNGSGRQKSRRVLDLLRG
jgi:hypothetical protein